MRGKLGKRSEVVCMLSDDFLGIPFLIQIVYDENGNCNQNLKGYQGKCFFDVYLNCSILIDNEIDVLVILDRYSLLLTHKKIIVIIFTKIMCLSRCPRVLPIGVD